MYMYICTYGPRNQPNQTNPHTPSPQKKQRRPLRPHPRGCIGVAHRRLYPRVPNGAPPAPGAQGVGEIREWGIGFGTPFFLHNMALIFLFVFKQTTNRYVIKAHDDTAASSSNPTDHKHKQQQQQHRTLQEDKRQKQKQTKGGDGKEDDMMVVVENSVLALGFSSETGRLVRGLVCLFVSCGWVGCCFQFGRCWGAHVTSDIQPTHHTATPQTKSSQTNPHTIHATPQNPNPHTQHPQ